MGRGLCTVQLVVVYVKCISLRTEVHSREGWGGGGNGVLCIIVGFLLKQGSQKDSPASTDINVYPNSYVHGMAIWGGGKYSVGPYLTKRENLFSHLQLLAETFSAEAPVVIRLTMRQF